MVNKKAQGMSINVIIIAAIALAVLVVLFAIFTGRIGLFSQGVQKSEESAYKCVCAAPTANRGCASVAPVGKAPIIPQSIGCSQWTDCSSPLVCYSTA